MQGRASWAKRIATRMSMPVSVPISLLEVVTARTALPDASTDVREREALDRPSSGQACEVRLVYALSRVGARKMHASDGRTRHTDTQARLRRQRWDARTGTSPLLANARRGSAGDVTGASRGDDSIDLNSSADRRDASKPRQSPPRASPMTATSGHGLSSATAGSVRGDNAARSKLCAGPACLGGLASIMHRLDGYKSERVCVSSSLIPTSRPHDNMRSTLALLALAAMASAATNETSVMDTSLGAKTRGVGDVCSFFSPCPGWDYPYCSSGVCGASAVLLHLLATDASHRRRWRRLRERRRLRQLLRRLLGDRRGDRRLHAVQSVRYYAVALPLGRRLEDRHAIEGHRRSHHRALAVTGGTARVSVHI